MTRRNGKYHTLDEPMLEKHIEKDQWHRMPEREKTNAPVLRTSSFEHQRVRWSRTVLHIGYWMTPTEMPLDLLEAETILAAVDNVNRALKSPIQLAHMEDWSAIVPNPIAAENAILSFEAIEKVCAALGIRPAKAFQALRYQVRFRWWQAQAKHQKNEDQNIRTIWYLDHAPLHGVILPEYKLAVCGERIPAEQGSGYEDDYGSPPQMVQWIRQRLYQVEPLEMPDVLPLSVRAYRVHPLDLEIVK